MSCSYYEFRQNDFYCHRKKDYVNSDVYYKYCRGYNYDECPIYKNHEQFDSRCFLSSACISAKGLSDDCEELMCLRLFRDNWLVKQPYGVSTIEDYYRIAPSVVENINKNRNSSDIYEWIYEKMVLPCVEHIKSEQYEAAYELYRDMAYRVFSEYGIYREGK